MHVHKFVCLLSFSAFLPYITSTYRWSKSNSTWIFAHVFGSLTRGYQFVPNLKTCCTEVKKNVVFIVCNYSLLLCTNKQWLYWPSSADATALWALTPPGAGKPWGVLLRLSSRPSSLRGALGAASSSGICFWRRRFLLHSSWQSCHSGRLEGQTKNHGEKKTTTRTARSWRESNWCNLTENILWWGHLVWIHVLEEFTAQGLFSCTALAGVQVQHVIKQVQGRQRDAAHKQDRLYNILRGWTSILI